MFKPPESSSSAANREVNAVPRHLGVTPRPFGRLGPERRASEDFRRKTWGQKSGNQSRTRNPRARFGRPDAADTGPTERRGTEKSDAERQPKPSAQARPLPLSVLLPIVQPPALLSLEPRTGRTGPQRAAGEGKYPKSALRRLITAPRLAPAVGTCVQAAHKPSKTALVQERGRTGRARRPPGPPQSRHSQPCTASRILYAPGGMQERSVKGWSDPSAAVAGINYVAGLSHTRH